MYFVMFITQSDTTAGFQGNTVITPSHNRNLRPEVGANNHQIKCRREPLASKCVSLTVTPDPLWGCPPGVSGLVPFHGAELLLHLLKHCLYCTGATVAENCRLDWMNIFQVTCTDGNTVYDSWALKTFLEGTYKFHAA